MTVLEFNPEPPREVWVVSTPLGPEFVAGFREGAMDHAYICAGEFPEHGPYRVCKYVAEPFSNLAGEMLEALEAVVRVADRATVEFDMARAAIAKAKGE